MGFNRLFRSHKAVVAYICRNLRRQGLHDQGIALLTNDGRTLQARHYGYHGTTWSDDWCSGCRPTVWLITGPTLKDPELCQQPSDSRPPGDYLHHGSNQHSPLPGNPHSKRILEPEYIYFPVDRGEPVVIAIRVLLGRCICHRVLHMGTAVAEA